MLSALRNLLFTYSFHSCKHRDHSWTFKNKLMRFDTFSIQSFLPVKQIQGEFPATHRLQNQFYATFIPWLDAACSACLVLTSMLFSALRLYGFVPRMEQEWREMLCHCSLLAVVCFQISFKLLNIFFFLCPGLILQLKLFCLALTQLTERHSLEQWRFTRLVFLPTPPCPQQRSVLRYQSDWDCWCTITS